MTPPRIRALELPTDWTPKQALAVFQMIELLRDHLWLLYAADIQRVVRHDQQLHRDPRQLHIPLDGEPPF